MSGFQLPQNLSELLQPAYNVSLPGDPEVTDSDIAAARTGHRAQRNPVVSQSAHRCGGCVKTWPLSALAACHCSACHRTFSGESHFSRHRVVDENEEHGRCLDPEFIRDRSGAPVMFYRRGMWRGPEITEEQKLALKELDSR